MGIGKSRSTYTALHSVSPLPETRGFIKVRTCIGAFFETCHSLILCLYCKRIKFLIRKSLCLIFVRSYMASRDLELEAFAQPIARVGAVPAAAEELNQQVESPAETPGEERQEFSLPPVDGGKDAWLFLAACWAIEALVWGTI